ncbi:MAG TPA: NAD(P)/FAD-dependent oxidoreductase [Chloroflexota bacterium]
MYDIIVVGARCAGAPTAMLLARRGYRVLLVDRSAFPSEIMSTHYIHQYGAARLRRWGLAAQVAATNCPPLTRMRFDVGPFALTGTPPPVDGAAEAYCPRRSRLDPILVDAAVAAGVEFRPEFSVQALCWDGDRVTGLRGAARGGATVTEQARLVVGADGLHSRVARAVRAPTYHARPALTCGYYSYWSGMSCEGAELYPRDQRFAVAFPTNDGLTCVAVQWTHDEFAAFRADVESNFLRTLEEMPDLAERVRAGRREERFVGTADLPNFFRRPYGPGWALVGDAGYHQDPNTGLGISNAFRDAELLAAAIDDGLAARRPLDAALADYERQRNEAAMPQYEFTCEVASLQAPPPEKQRLFGALRGNQPDTDRFFGVMAGSVPVAEFFAEENVQRILAAEAAAGAGVS